MPPLYLARSWIIKILGDAEAWLLCARWSLLLSAQPQISGKSEHFNYLIIIFSFFVSPCSTYFLVSLVDFLVPPSYLVPVCLVAVRVS